MISGTGHTDSLQAPMLGHSSQITNSVGTHPHPLADAAAAAKLLQSCPTLCDPIDGSPPGSPSLGFSRQEHWSGLPFLSPEKKVKSESEVTQSCPTLRNPMDCSPPGSSIHGIFQARLEWGAIAFSGENVYSKALQWNVLR